MLWHSAASCKVSQISQFLAFFPGTTGFILIKLWFLFMLWHSAATCTVSQFFALFIGSTGFILINLWFLFMLCHSAANCKVSKFSHIFAFFWRTTGVHQIFDFCLCCGTLQPIIKFHKFSSLFGIFLRNYWSGLDQTLIFVYAPCHSAANCNCFQIFFTFLHFSQELLVWSWSNFDICPCCGTLQPIVKFQNFLTFLHFSQELLVWSWSNFYFCLCCATLQPIVKFQNFLTFLHFSEGTTGLHLDKSLIFVHAVAFCSQLQSFTNFSVFCIFLRNFWFDLHQIFQFCLCCATLQSIVKFQNFFTFLHFSQELLVWSWSNFDFCFMLWHSTANCKVSKFSSLFCIFLKEILVWSSSSFDFCSCCGTLHPVAMF